MKKFHYKLEPLLHLKKHKEEEWQQHLARATGSCLNVSRTIETCEEERRSTLQNCFRRGSNTGDYQTSQLYMNRLAREEGQLKQQLKEQEKEREDIRKQYLEAAKERKILEKLKERQQGVYLKEQRKRQQAVLDEIASGAAARRAEQNNQQEDFPDGR